MRPTLTIRQYQEGVRLFRAEVANIAWSLVEGPAAVGTPRRWRSLTPDQSLDLFDQLQRAITRMASKDGARVVERLSIDTGGER
jgi:hypothetical protein